MALGVGDVIRLEMVATVTAVDATTITVTTFGSTPVVFPKAIAGDPGFSYETVPTPEPAYTAGELYRDAGGNVYQRTGAEMPGDRWRVLLHSSRPIGQYVGEFVPVRPLARLTSGG